jgi:beta-glucosidase
MTLTPEQERRVEELLAAMTLEEKSAQITAVGIGELMEDGRLSRPLMERHLQHGIGQMTRIAGATTLDPPEVAALANEIQRFLVEETRLGIPAIVHEECLSGFMGMKGTTFPQAIGMGATWDPGLITQVTAVIRQQARAAGSHLMLAPLADIARDPRWGRTEETFGEDPYLVSRMATAYVRGLQGDDLTQGVAATLKHFAGYGFSEGGRNCAPVHVGPREFREHFLFPFQVAIREGGALSVMAAYHDVDGVPASGDRWLLTRVLRDEWGFEGIVVADYGSISMLYNFHHVAADAAEAGRVALQAGLDVELPSHECYGETLLHAVRQGIVSEELVDRAVRRHLRVKAALGLLDGALVKPEAAALVFDTPEQRELAREVARRSITLLKNQGGLLPLPKDARAIAVVGPNANSTQHLLGDYAYTTHFLHERDAVPIVTVLEGVRAKVSPQTEVHHAEGCGITEFSPSDFAAALRAANLSDTVIAVVGDKSAVAHGGTSGEHLDATQLGLPGAQEELLRMLSTVGKPLIVVLVNGRPMGSEWLVENATAIVEAWLPGEEGGNAIADVLFGDCNPGGKLPVSILRNAGQAPNVYNRHLTSHPSFQKYVDAEREPLFPFGHGLSYTEFAYSNLRITPAEVTTEDEVEVSCEVRNVGEQAGDEVVQLYIHDPLASVARPRRELKGFARISLEPGATKRVTFHLPLDLLAYYDPEMNLGVEAGEIQVMIGSSSEDIRLEGKFELREGRSLSELGRMRTEVEIA